MKVTKVCCQGCGADLQIDESIRYVTCNYCHTRLEVVHDQTVTHTRQLDKIERNTARMADNLKVIELQNDLERLDREWENRRRNLMVKGKDGHLSEPSSAGAVLVGIISVGFGIFFISATMDSRAPALFPTVGFGIVVFAIVGMVRGKNKATAFRTGSARYHGERRRLVSRLDAERRDS
jgi:hypothetical protein